MLLLVFILTSPFWLLYFTISLIFELSKKINYKKIVFDLYNNKTIKIWIVMISDLVFNVSAGLFTVVLAFFGLSFAIDIKLFNTKAVDSFINYDISVIWFIMVYAIIMATISWYVKNEIKGKK